MQLLPPELCQVTQMSSAMATSTQEGVMPSLRGDASWSAPTRPNSHSSVDAPSGVPRATSCEGPSLPGEVGSCHSLGKCVLSHREPAAGKTQHVTLWWKDSAKAPQTSGAPRIARLYDDHLSTCPQSWHPRGHARVGDLLRSCGLLCPAV